MEIRRRDFLKLVGGLSGGAVLGSYGVDPMYAVPKSLIDKATYGPRIESWKNTICRLCPGGCGLRVRLINDIPITLKGNPLNPVNRGGLCPMGLSALQSLYHPDRLQGPLKRSGDVRSGSWQALSWDDALSMVSEKLSTLRMQGNAHHVAILGSDETGFAKDHLERFAAAYGTPNYHTLSAKESKRAGYILTQGDPRIPCPDIVNTRLVVSFGANILEEGPSPVYFTKLYSRHDEQNTKYIHVDAHMNRTGSNADRWVPIRPGTYGALALGIAYVLIREELYDERFVRGSSFGFEDWVDASGERHSGFKTLVLGDYYPERVQEITGVPSSVILQLGRELGNTRPSVALCDHGAIDHTNGTFTIMAVNAVNALLGNYEQEGGIYVVDEPPLSSFGRTPTDTQARNGLAQPPIGKPANGNPSLVNFTMEDFLANVQTGSPYPIDVLFILGGNPVFESTHQKAFEKALERIPMIVSFDPMMSETSEYAHIIMPDHHFLEQWNMVSNVEGVGFTHIGIQQPVIEPLYDTRHVGDVFIDLAGRIDGAPHRAYPYRSYEDGLRATMQGIFDSASGAITAEGTGRRWLEFFNQRGWRIDRHSSFEEFWDRLTTYAGWWNPIRTRKSLRTFFKTPTRRFEFHSKLLKDMVETAARRGATSVTAVLQTLGVSAGGDTAYMPHYEPLPGDQSFPLQLITFRRLPVGDGRGASLPLMQELFGHGADRHWESWAELHPDTARLYGITDGAWILVQSPHGAVRLRSKVSEGVMKDVVAIPFGLGHTSGGRYARGYGVNPNILMGGLHDPLSGRAASQATHVSVLAE